MFALALGDAYGILLDAPFLRDLDDQKDHESYDHKGYQRYQEVSHTK